MSCVDANPWTWIQILVRLFWDIRDIRVGRLGRTLFDLRRARVKRAVRSSHIALALPAHDHVTKHHHRDHAVLFNSVGVHTGA
jgi:hypothetical protein